MRKCPKCQGQGEVKDSRERHNTVRRTRQCCKCANRWITYESAVAPEQLDRELKDASKEVSLSQRLERFVRCANSLTKDLGHLKARLQHLENEVIEIGDEVRAVLEQAPATRRMAVSVPKNGATTGVRT